MDWNNFLREVFAAELIANPIAIGGPNTTVEVGESLLACRKNHQGRNLPQQWVFSVAFAEKLRECFASHHCAIHSTMLDSYARSLAVLELRGFSTLQSINHTLNFVYPVYTHKTSKIPRRMPSGGTKSNMEHIAQ